MPKIIWFNQPTNHSSTLNFLYLTPEGDVEVCGIDYPVDGNNQTVVMGGPSLFDGYEPSDATLTLMSFFDKGIRFFPQSIEEKVNQVVREAIEKASTDDEADKDAIEQYVFEELIGVYSKCAT